MTTTSGPSRVRRGRGPFFSPVPFDILDDPELDAYAIATYAAIRSFADFGSGDGARVSDATIARRAGCSDRTVRARRDLLASKGWIEWRSGKGEGDPNEYLVHASLARAVEVGSEGDAEGSEGDAEGVGTTFRPGRHEVPSTESQIPISITERRREKEEDVDPPVFEMHRIFVDVLGGDPPHPKATAKRRKLYAATWDEGLGELRDPLDVWRRVCEKIRDDPFLGKKRAYQMPDSFLRNEERRERHVLEVIRSGVTGNREEGGTDLRRVAY